ncbi:Aldo/keto reductase [Ramaria rubella]|nr:Aldo/keto reductase [Ramaria rubella]
MPLPNILYGTAWKKERTAELVVKAVLQGFRGIDTACQPKHYREDLVGNALLVLQETHNIKREEIFLQTKFTSIAGQDRSKPLPYDPLSPVRDQVLASFTVSLRNLHTTYLDSYILHSPLETLGRTLEAWRVLIELQDEGKVRLIGVSNTYDIQMLDTLCELRKVQIVQNRWYQGNNWDQNVCAYCLFRGIQYQSFWTLSGSPSLLNHPSVLALAERASCTPAQTLFKLAQIRGIVPLAGSTDEDRMKQGVQAERINLEQCPESKEAIANLNALIGGS